jgi:membrane-bound inhibitor of C-type lysozyme
MPGQRARRRSWKARAVRAALMFLCAFVDPVGGTTPSAAQAFLTFHCRDGTELVTVFYQGTRDAYIQLDGKSMTLPRRISFSGTRYSAGGITLRIKENSVTLSRRRRTTECSSG